MDKEMFDKIVERNNLNEEYPYLDMRLKESKAKVIRRKELNAEIENYLKEQ